MQIPAHGVTGLGRERDGAGEEWSSHLGLGRNEVQSGRHQGPTTCFQAREASFPSDRLNSLGSRFLRFHVGLCCEAPCSMSEARLPRAPLTTH